MSYKDEQNKTRDFLSRVKLISPYKFNAFPNRAKRREFDKDSGENVQTYRKPKVKK